MPTVEIILREDEGHRIDSQSVKKYPRNWKGRSFHDMEGAVEPFKRRALPAIEAGLREAAQKAFIEGKKKTCFAMARPRSHSKRCRGDLNLKYSD